MNNKPAVLTAQQWANAEELVKQGLINEAIEAMLPIVVTVTNRFSRKAKHWNLEYDDVIGEGQLGLVEGVHTWKPGGFNIKNWCYRRISLAVQRYMDAEISYKTQRVIDSVVIGEEGYNPMNTTEYGIDALKLITKASGRLSDLEHHLLRLLLVDDMSIPEIADSWNVSAQYVHTLYVNVKEIVRAEL